MPTAAPSFPSHLIHANLLTSSVLSTNTILVDNNTMAVAGLRRSTRARKPVKSYAEEQAEANHDVADQPPSKKRKTASHPKQLEAKDSEYESEGEELTVKSSGSKKSKASKKSAGDSPVTGWTKKGRSVFVVDPKTIPTDTSWHASAAERRIAVRQRDVRHLAPGEQETRLKA